MKKKTKTKTSTDKPGPLADAVEKVTASLKTMMERTSAEMKRVADYAHGKKPPACPFGASHQLDIEESARQSMGREEIMLVWTPCDRCRESAMKPWLARSGVPDNLMTASFDNWKPRLASDHAILAKVRKFAKDLTGFCVLTGPVGTGKTHLAVAIMREARAGVFTTQNQFLSALRKTYRDPKAPDPVERCKATALLVFDEMGLSTGGRDEGPAIYEVINHRYGARLPTVITTNEAVHDWKEVFGDRIADRLSDNIVLCETKGPSMRGRKS